MEVNINGSDTKRQERAAFSLVAMANTKARGETLIEATEWHAQSNWISSAVSSNLIWPALWRMTGEPRHVPPPAPPSGCAPHAQRTHRRAASAQQLANICCVGCHLLLPALLLRRSSQHPRGGGQLLSSAPCVPLCSCRPPRVSAAFSHLCRFGLWPPDTSRSQAGRMMDVGRAEEQEPKIYFLPLNVYS